MSSAEEAKFRERLSKVVKRAGGQVALGAASGVKQQQISSYLSGRRSPASAFTLGRIVRAEGMSLDWLVMGEERPVDEGLLADVIDVLSGNWDFKKKGASRAFAVAANQLYNIYLSEYKDSPINERRAKVVEIWSRKAA